MKKQIYSTKCEKKQGFLSNSFFATFVQQQNDNFFTRPAKKIDRQENQEFF